VPIWGQQYLSILLIAASDNTDISGNQVHPAVEKLCPNNDAVFQDDNAQTHSQKCSVLV
jgi:hypothetical protein